MAQGKLSPEDEIEELLSGRLKLSQEKLYVLLSLREWPKKTVNELAPAVVAIEWVRSFLGGLFYWQSSFPPNVTHDTVYINWPFIEKTRIMVSTREYFLHLPNTRVDAVVPAFWWMKPEFREHAKRIAT